MPGLLDPVSATSISSRPRSSRTTGISSLSAIARQGTSSLASITRLTTGNLRPSQITWSKGVLSNLLYFRDGNGNLRMVIASGLGTSTPALVPFSAKMTVSRDEEFAEMFEQSWRAVHENFYDPNFHGANWILIREKYRPLVKHVVLREDFYDLISLMIGELNAGHTYVGGGDMPRPTRILTGLLGAQLQQDANTKYYRITKILPGANWDRTLRSCWGAGI